MFLVVTKKSRTFFSASRVWLMSRCAGAGREHRQAANPIWPMEIFHTIDITLSLWMGVGLRAGVHEFHDHCLGWQLITGWWEIVLCITCILVIITLSYFCCPVKLSLSQPTSCAFLSISPPHPTAGGSERAAVWCLAAGCWVKP